MLYSQYTFAGNAANTDTLRTVHMMFRVCLKGFLNLCSAYSQTRLWLRITVETIKVESEPQRERKREREKERKRERDHSSDTENQKNTQKPKQKHTHTETKNNQSKLKPYLEGLWTIVSDCFVCMFLVCLVCLFVFCAVFSLFWFFGCPGFCGCFGSFGVCWFGFSLCRNFGKLFGICRNPWKQWQEAHRGPTEFNLADSTQSAGLT